MPRAVPTEKRMSSNKGQPRLGSPESSPSPPAKESDGHLATSQKGRPQIRAVLGRAYSFNANLMRMFSET